MLPHVHVTLCRLCCLQPPQVVELTGNAGMSGTFGYQATEENNQNSALCKTVQGGLRILNMNGLGLAGLALPDCLMGPKSTLEEIRLGAWTLCQSAVAARCVALHADQGDRLCPADRLVLQHRGAQ